LSTTLERKTPPALTTASFQAKALNAESVTNIATGFLKRIGNKGGLKPKRVSLEEGMYTVEIELKKFSALVHIDAETHDIKGYEIQPRAEEASPMSISPKTIILIFGISAGVHIALYFGLRMIGF
jgi:hypothetical protein